MIDKEKEQKEIERLRRDQSFQGSRNYFWILIAVLTVIYVVDELTSSVRGAVQTYTICDLFNTTFDSAEYAGAQATLGLVTTGCYLIFLISPLYKSLADKYGRKIFLVINTIGMGVGMLLCIISSSMIVYLMGCVVMTFFTPNDAQVLYIMECAPKKHRAKLCSITKGIALISVSLLGFMIRAFVSYDNPSSWRYVFVLPIILAFVIGLLAIYFVKETPVYTNERLAYLEMSEEERIAKEEEAKAQNKSGEEMGVMAAFKYIFRHKQTKAIAIVCIILAFSTGYTGMYEPMLTAGISQGVMSVADKETFMIIYPLFNGILTLVSGFITDHFGRKKSAIILGLWTAVGLAIFVMGCTIGLPALATSIGYGLSIAGLWSVSDMLYFVITSESTPTRQRGAVVGCMQLIGMVGTGLNMVFNALSSMIFGTSHLAIGLSLTYLPILAIALVIMMLKIEETKNVDLDNIGEEE